MGVIKIGVVGSRNRECWFEITGILRQWKEKAESRGHIICVVSGGAKGVDSTAKQVARQLKLQYEEYLPNKDLWLEKGNDIYYERNKKIAEASFILYAFPENMRGGTMNTVKWFKAKKDYKRSRLHIIDDNYDEVFD